MNEPSTSNTVRIRSRGESTDSRACRVRRLAALEPHLQVLADQPVLAAEQAVEGRLGDAGLLDDAVDPDGVDALLVEELVGGGEQPVTGRLRRRVAVTRGGGCDGGHVSLTLTDRSV